MRKDTVPESRKVAEAKKLRLFFERKKNNSACRTQEQLGEELGVTQGLVGQWFSGKTSISDRRLVALAKLLGFDPRDVRPDIAVYLPIIEESPLQQPLSGIDLEIQRELTHISDERDKLAILRMIKSMQG